MHLLHVSFANCFSDQKSVSKPINYVAECLSGKCGWDCLRFTAVLLLYLTQLTVSWANWRHTVYIQTAYYIEINTECMQYCILLTWTSHFYSVYWLFIVACSMKLLDQHGFICQFRLSKFVVLESKSLNTIMPSCAIM